MPGFFSSIATAQFLQAWRTILEFYRQRHGIQPDTIVTVDLKERAQQLCIFRGKRRGRTTRQVRFWTDDVPTFILHALALQHFKVAGRGFRQAHESPMGSPLSPALFGMVIAAQEEIWGRAVSVTCSNMNRNLLSLRYVDNRLWISERRFEQLPAVRLFLDSRFYRGDIILDDEPAVDFVGFSLDLHNRRIHYNRACQARDLPSNYSASPQPVQLSGVSGRAHTIKKCAYPKAQALSELRFLWNLAEERGLPIHTLAFKAKFWHLP